MLLRTCNEEHVPTFVDCVGEVKGEKARVCPGGLVCWGRGEVLLLLDASLPGLLVPVGADVERRRVLSTSRRDGSPSTDRRTCCCSSEGFCPRNCCITSEYCFWARYCCSSSSFLCSSCCSVNFRTCSWRNCVGALFPRSITGRVARSVGLLPLDTRTNGCEEDGCISVAGDNLT